MEDHIEQVDRTLSRNGIKQFLIRIDLASDCKISLELLANTLAPQFKGLIKQVIPNINVNLDAAEVKKEDLIHYIITVDTGIAIKLDPTKNSIIFESNHYTNNLIYKTHIDTIIESLRAISNNDSINATRIGMRYINYYTLSKPQQIKNVFQTNHARSIETSLHKPNISRCVNVEEFTTGSYQIRVQYGIPNSYYPKVITTHDLLLDIDIYHIGQQNIADWTNSIKEYNHAAYQMFDSYIKESYKESLK